MSFTFKITGLADVESFTVEFDNANIKSDIEQAQPIQKNELSKADEALDALEAVEAVKAVKAVDKLDKKPKIQCPKEKIQPVSRPDKIDPVLKTIDF